MNRYRSLDTIYAVQFTGEPILDVTCHGTPADVQAHGCDASRKQHTHVHTQATGGMTVLKPGDWIYPVPGGPWGVASDGRFRGSWEVPAPIPAMTAVPASEPVELPSVVLFPEAVPQAAVAPGADFEVRHYADGTTASGAGPLPVVSPSGAPAVSTIGETSVSAGPVTLGPAAPALFTGDTATPSTPQGAVAGE